MQKAWPGPGSTASCWLKSTTRIILLYWDRSYYLSGQWKQARIYLEKAHLADPGSLTYAALLARLYLAQEDYFLIPSLLRPFLEDAQVLPFDFYYTLGRAYQRLGNQTQALRVLNTARDHYGLNTWLLNMLGEIHYQQGQWAEAQAAWQKSLEIQPDQPAIRKLFDSLKEKKRILAEGTGIGIG